MEHSLVTDSPTSLPRLLRRGEVQALTGLSRSTIYRLIYLGDFPQPVRLSTRAVAWRIDEIAIWLERRSAQRADLKWLPWNSNGH